MSENSVLLQVQNLKVSFRTPAGIVQAVRGVSFNLNQGETLAIVGESGCGKSVTARTVMGLTHRPGIIDPESHILFEGQDILTFSEKRMQAYHGGDAAIVFQDAMASLNPTMTIGNQIIETLRHHNQISKKAAEKEAVDLLRKVGISQPEQRVKQYPHQLSGGMRQRVMIAIAFANKPKLLVADEPTTALDVTIQSQIIDLIRDLQKENGTSVILITHDLGVVASIADRIAVMYAGKIVEHGSAHEIFHHPCHPYTNALLSAVPRLDQDRGGELTAIAGTPPDLLNPPAGCGFCTRCQYCMQACLNRQPPVYRFEQDHEASCWLYALEKTPDDAPFVKEEFHV